MNRISIIGDSNVYRNINPQRISKRLGKTVSITQATKRASLEIALKETGQEVDTLLVSALPNIICDAFTVAPSEPNLIIEIETYLNLLATNSTVSRILLVPPFFRSIPPWFGEQLPLMLRQLSALSKQNEKFTVLPEFKVSGVDLIQDGVHLSKESGNRFYEYLASTLLDLLQSTESPSDSVTSADVMALIKSSVLPKLDILPTVQTKVSRANLLLLLYLIKNLIS